MLVEVTEGLYGNNNVKYWDLKDISSYKGSQ
jgi:hypothetical protein